MLLLLFHLLIICCFSFKTTWQQIGNLLPEHNQNGCFAVKECWYDSNKTVFMKQLQIFLVVFPQTFAGVQVVWQVPDSSTGHNDLEQFLTQRYLFEYFAACLNFCCVYCPFDCGARILALLRPQCTDRHSLGQEKTVQLGHFCLLALLLLLSCLYFQLSSFVMKVACDLASLGLLQLCLNTLSEGDRQIRNTWICCRVLDQRYQCIQRQLREFQLRCPMPTIIQTIKKHDVPLPPHEVKACTGKEPLVHFATCVSLDQL